MIRSLGDVIKALALHTLLYFTHLACLASQTLQQKVPYQLTLETTENVQPRNNIKEGLIIVDSNMGLLIGFEIADLT